MKRLISAICATAALSVALNQTTGAQSLPPGQVDFGAFTPPASGGEFVEINVPANLISLAAQFIQKQEPDVAQLINGLQQVHVNVIGLDDQNRPEVEKRVQKVRKDLEAKGWESVVTVQKDDQNVAVYIKTKEKEAIQGLAVVVVEGKKQAVFVNIVGDIKPAQLAMLGDRLHIDPLKQAGLAVEKAEHAQN